MGATVFDTSLYAFIIAILGMFAVGFAGVAPAYGERVGNGV
jgi:hypothetical protein